MHPHPAWVHVNILAGGQKNIAHLSWTELQTPARPNFGQVIISFLAVSAISSTHFIGFCKPLNQSILKSFYERCNKPSCAGR